MNMVDSLRYMSKFIPGKARDGGFQKIYPDYESSLNDCEGYEYSDVINVVLEKTKILKNKLDTQILRPIETRQTIQNLLIFSHIYKGFPLNIIDFGGACGATYLEAKYYLPNNINKWYIVETKQMSDVGKKSFQDDNLKFYSKISEIDSDPESKDLIIASAVLQYTRDPLMILKCLLDMDYKYVYLTRTLLSTNMDKTLISRQVSSLSANGPGPLPEGFKDNYISYPITFIPINNIYKNILESNYEIVFNFEESAPTMYDIGSNKTSLIHSGFLLKKSN